MEDNNICPFKNLLTILPENYCQVKGSYCIWPCEYTLCDTYKKAYREINMLENLKGKDEQD